MKVLYNINYKMLFMSKTEENLKVSFSGESQARNKYTFFAEIARKEGYHYIAKLFEETAENEMQHAKSELELLNGIGSTEENLLNSIAGEKFETEVMYPEYEKTAEEEGNKKAATLFRQVKKIEEHHKSRYEKILDLLKNGSLYKRDEPIEWKCLKCGYVYVGTEAPKFCPACGNSQGYFEPNDIF